MAATTTESSVDKKVNYYTIRLGRRGGPPGGRRAGGGGGGAPAPEHPN
jgi:hypothetical protein